MINCVNHLTGHTHARTHLYIYTGLKLNEHLVVCYWPGQLGNIGNNLPNLMEGAIRLLISDPCSASDVWLYEAYEFVSHPSIRYQLLLKNCVSKIAWPIRMCHSLGLRIHTDVYALLRAVGHRA